MFFQGWRLDPILQFGMSLLVLGIAVEMIPSFINDCQGWRSRIGRASATILVNKQLSDKK